MSTSSIRSREFEAESTHAFIDELLPLPPPCSEPPPPAGATDELPDLLFGAESPLEADGAEFGVTEVPGSELGDVGEPAAGAGAGVCVVGAAVLVEAGELAGAAGVVVVMGNVVVDVVFLVLFALEFSLEFPLEFPLEDALAAVEGSVLKVAHHHWIKLAMVEKYCVQFDRLILFLSLEAGWSLERRV